MTQDAIYALWFLNGVITGAAVMVAVAVYYLWKDLDKPKDE